MSGRIKKDSRYRTIVRENGKVFVTWFGAKFKQPEGSKLAVGSEVELMAGSTLAVAVIRHKDAAELGLPEEAWHLRGIEGGDRMRPKVERDWQKIQEELGNPHPVMPASAKVQVVGRVGPDISPETLPEESKVLILTAPSTFNDIHHHLERRKSKHDKDVDDIRELAAQYDYLGIGQRLEVQFGTHDKASTFRLAMVRKGFRVGEEVRETGNGRQAVDVYINVKPR